MKDIILSVSPILSIPLTVIAWWVVHTIALPGTTISFLGVSYTKRISGSRKHKFGSDSKEPPKEEDNNNSWQEKNNVFQVPKWVHKWRLHVQEFPNAKYQFKIARYISLCLGALFLYPALGYFLEWTFSSDFLNAISSISVGYCVGGYMSFLIFYVLEKIAGDYAQ